MNTTEAYATEAEDEQGLTHAYLKPDAVGSILTEHKGTMLVGAWFQLDDYRFAICLSRAEAESWAWDILNAIDDLKGSDES